MPQHWTNCTVNCECEGDESLSVAFLGSKAIVRATSSQESRHGARQGWLKGLEGDSSPGPGNLIIPWLHGTQLRIQGRRSEWFAM